MPTLEQYRKRMTIGESLKHDSDLIMESTWDIDPQSRVAYLYDQEHDEEFEKETNLHPQETSKIPVDIKLVEMEYNSLSKDTQGFHIQFKPSYVPNVPYYEEKFAKKWKAHFPVGLYADIQDSNGVYHRWLIVDQYKEYSIQFPSWIVLPCDFKAQWIHKHKKYESWGVLRSQNS